MPAPIAPEKPLANRPGKDSAPETIEFGEFVDDRIHKTRSAVKGADLAAGLGTLLAMALGFLLVVALIEHWFVPGGLSTTERAGALALALIGAGLYAGRRLAPLITRKINPLYAAQEIERDSPGIKNSLINLLQLRSQREGNVAVCQALERQAAERLAVAEQPHPDRSGLLRVAWTLLVLVVLIATYIAISPKDFFTTAKRIALPWADIAAPSRVQIEDLQPGAITISQGDVLDVSARLLGMSDSDRAILVYSTRDRSAIDHRIEMRSEPGAVRYDARLSGLGGLGLQSDLWYRVEAGDARSKLFEVRVLASPTIAPVAIRLDYPAYTGYSSRQIVDSGDIVAIEGTQVTLQAEANLEVDSAQIDLGSDGRPDVRLKPDGATATGQFVLVLDEQERGASLRSSYLLRFTSVDGQANHDPAQYRLEITPDYAPEAALVTPEEKTVQLGVDQQIEIVAEARDPDFALQSVRLVGEAAGKRVVNVPLTSGEHRGKLRENYLLTPSEHNLQPGDELLYWVEATDNRAPLANRAVSARKTIIVTGPAEEQAGEGEQQQNGAGGQGQPDPNGQDQTGQAGEDQQQQESSTDGQQGQQQSDQGAPGEQQPGQEGTQPKETQQQESQQGEEGESQQQQEGMQAPGEESAGAEQQENQTGANGQGESGEQGESQTEPSAGQNGGQQGERRPGTPSGGEQRPVPSDGSDDGQAFERIREHLEDQKEESNGAQREGGQQGERGESSDGWRPRESGEPSPDRPEGMDQAQPGDERQGEQSDSQSSEAGGEVEPGQESKETSAPREGIGDSGESQAADDGSGQSADQGPGESSGQAGEEQPSGERTGESSGENPGEGSESRPSEEGQQNGTGQQGAQEGPKEQGAEGSEQQNGEGDPNQQTGQQSTDQTDRQASERPGQTGDQQSGQPGEQLQQGDRQPNGDPSGTQQGAGEGDPSDQESEPSDQQTEPGQPSARQGDSRGGTPGDRPGEDDSSEAPLSEPGGDQANLEYARKQTELVLEKLADQLAKKQIDQELLDKLGWSEQEMRKFVARWLERQQRAAERGAEGASELDAALKSLGLKPGGPTEQAKIGEDQLRDLKQRVRTAPPPELRDRLRQYNRGVSSAGEDDNP